MTTFYKFQMAWGRRLGGVGVWGGSTRYRTLKIQQTTADSMFVRIWGRRKMCP